MYKIYTCISIKHFWDCKIRKTLISCNDKVNRKQLRKGHRSIFWSNVSYSMAEKKENYLHVASNICVFLVFSFPYKNVLNVLDRHYCWWNSDNLKTFQTRVRPWSMEKYSSIHTFHDTGSCFSVSPRKTVHI